MKLIRPAVRILKKLVVGFSSGLALAIGIYSLLNLGGILGAMFFMLGVISFLIMLKHNGTKSDDGSFRINQ